MNSHSTETSRRHWGAAAAFALGLLALLVLLSPTTGQDLAGDVPPRLVELRTADVVMRPGVYELGGGRYGVVELGHALRRAELEALGNRGVRLLSYLGDNVFIAGIDPGALTGEVARDYDIRAAAPWGSDNKATAELRQMAREATGDPIDVTILFFGDMATEQMQAILDRNTLSYRIVAAQRLWTASVEPARLGGLLAEQGIHVVHTGDGRLDPVLDEVRPLVHVDEVQQATIADGIITYDGLTGADITLQVSEWVYDDHPDFFLSNGTHRFINPSPEWGDRHGTTVAGIMAGGGLLSTALDGTPFQSDLGQYRGMAPEAWLYDFVYFGGEGPKIDAANFSLTMGDETYQIGYSSRAALVDREIRGDEGRDFMFPQIWAAANQGATPQYDNEEGYYSIYTPAKNNIVVGSVNANDGGLSTFSSLGPTFDGRVKPDVMAPGGKNHLPREYDLFADRIAVEIDYIRVVNSRTGAISKAWEFNKFGDLEGWFENPDKYNIFNPISFGGSLIFQAGSWPSGLGDQAPWGWNETAAIIADPDDVVVMKYRMTMPSGTATAAGQFWFKHHDPNFVGKQPFGSVDFPVIADSSWHVISIPVGEWGLDPDHEVGGWQTEPGKPFNYIGMVPFGFNWPEIVSPSYVGERNNQQIFVNEGMQGTSMAAPVVTGGVALILEQFRNVHSIDLKANPPLASTIKAILIQTADDLIHETPDPRDQNNPDTGAPVIYYEGPDYATGYGLVNIKAAVDLVAADPGHGTTGRYIIENELDGDERHIYEFEVTAADQRANPGQPTFTLVWDDVAGDPTTPQTASKLVNDLDLYVIDPNGFIYRPWVLDPLPVADCNGAGPGCGDLDPIQPEDVVPAYKGIDHLNNVEMVQIYEAAVPGRWQVVVAAYHIPFPSQTYSLVANRPLEAMPRAIREGVTSRVSVHSDGSQGNGQADSFKGAISHTGRYVVFSAYATDLVADDTNDHPDIFIRDRQANTTSRVSINSNSQQANNASYQPAVSAYGRYVVFSSDADNLVSGDTNDATDIFVHDGQTGQTTRVSTRSNGRQANSSSFANAISGDGRYVAFASSATNLVSGDTNDASDIFVHDRQTGQTTRVSVSSAGGQGNGSSNLPTISADGRYVAFESWADNLVSGDTNDAGDVFVHDQETGQTTRVSVNSAGQQADNSSYYGSIAAEGRFVAFGSFAANLVEGDTNSGWDIFVHDQQTGQTSRVSVDSAGNQSSGYTIYPNEPAISADGRYIVFDSDADDLVVGDTEYSTDVFLHDRQTGQTTMVSVNSAGGIGNGFSLTPAISGDGQVVAFTSWASNLVYGDSNETGDVFVHEPNIAPSPADKTQLVLSAGYLHSCGLMSTGAVNCWGSNTYGQSTSQFGPFISFDSGERHNCGLTPEGAAFCWGDDEFGQAADHPGPFVEVSSAYNHNCGLLDSGAVVCWPEDGTAVTSGQAGPFSWVAAGDIINCAITGDGQLSCWGLDIFGLLDFPRGSFTQISMGNRHACALRNDGAIRCWGDNSDGQAENRDGPFLQVVAGGFHTCGLKPDGSVDCWGNNVFEQVDDQPGPFTQLTAGGYHTCGLSPDGSGVCWGDNSYGQAAEQVGPFAPYQAIHTVFLPLAVDGE